MRKHGFISHIHEEAKVAGFIKEWANHIFLGQLDMFVSSLDMRAGNWLEQIRDALKGTSFVFPLLSPLSKDRPWINFESGCAFITEQIQLIPLCHRGLRPSDLKPPFSFFQSYDLLKPSSVNALIRHLSVELDLDMPRVDLDEFSDEMLQLYKRLQQFYASFEELKSAEELVNALKDVEKPIEVTVDEIEIWDELELRARIHDRRIIELSGYTREATGFNIYDVEVPEGSNYLIVRFENSETSISHDQDKMLKLNINRQNVKSVIEGQKHYDDSQFTVKGDGLFAFALPPVVKHAGKIESMNFTFWRIELQGLLLQLYFA